MVPGIRPSLSLAPTIPIAIVCTGRADTCRSQNDEYDEQDPGNLCRRTREGSAADGYWNFLALCVDRPHRFQGIHLLRLGASIRAWPSR